MTTPETLTDFHVQNLAGQPYDLAQHRGRVVLVVNTASRCGFTPQYHGLQALHTQYSAQGLTVLAFPCNQFGAQEPGNAQDIESFCQTHFGLTFPLMGKVDVNGEGADPLYRWLCAKAPGLMGSKAIKWNFTKFLVARDGQTVKRYAPHDAPASLTADIEAALNAPAPARLSR